MTVHKSTGFRALRDVAPSSRARAPSRLTPLLPSRATVPNGGRGCWVNLAANDGLTAAACLSAVDASYRRGGLYKTVHVGYPHLMAKLRGAELRALLEGARELLGPGTTTSVDLNGVSADTHSPEVLGPALSCIDVLHCNEDEAPLVSGVKGTWQRERERRKNRDGPRAAPRPRTFNSFRRAPRSLRRDDGRSPDGS